MLGVPGTAATACQGRKGYLIEHCSLRPLLGWPQDLFSFLFFCYNKDWVQVLVHASLCPEEPKGQTHSAAWQAEQNSCHLPLVAGQREDLNFLSLGGELQCEPPSGMSLPLIVPLLTANTLGSAWHESAHQAFQAKWHLSLSSFEKKQRKIG